MSKLRIVVAVLITIVWTVAVTFAFAVDRELTGLVTVITPVMLAVVGWLYADDVIRRRNESKRNGNGGGS